VPSTIGKREKEFSVFAQGQESIIKGEKNGGIRCKEGLLFLVCRKKADVREKGKPSAARLRGSVNQNKEGIAKRGRDRKRPACLNLEKSAHSLRQEKRRKSPTTVP